METGVRILSEQDLNTLSTTAQVELGAVGCTFDGRIYRYVGFGGTSTIAPGLLVIAAAHTANFFGMTITAATVSGQPVANVTAGNLAANPGSKGSYLTLSNTTSSTAAADAFSQGYLEVYQTSGTNEGPILYKIKGNTAVTAGNVTTSYFTVFLDTKEPLRQAQALTPGTDTASVYASPFSAVNTSTTVGRAVGVTIMQVVNTSTVTNYGWVQSQGSVLLTNDAGGTVTVGEGIAQSTTTAGDIVAVAATTFQIGQTERAISASATGPCVINLV